MKPPVEGWGGRKWNNNRYFLIFIEGKRKAMGACYSDILTKGEATILLNIRIHTQNDKCDALTTPTYNVKDAMTTNRSTPSYVVNSRIRICKWKSCNAVVRIRIGILCPIWIAGGKRMIAFVWYEHQPCLNTASTPCFEGSTQAPRGTTSAALRPVVQ